MKKIFALVLTLALVLALSTAAFAAGSKTDAVEVKGGDVEVAVSDTTVAVITEEIAAEVADADADVKVLWQKDLSVAEGTTFPLTMTFHVDGTDGQMLYVYHHNGTAWELVGEGKGPDVTATFTSLSPVAIATVAKSAAGSESSPATGVAMGITVACGIFAAAGASAFAIAKKKD